MSKKYGSGGSVVEMRIEKGFIAWVHGVHHCGCWAILWATTVDEWEGEANRHKLT